MPQQVTWDAEKPKQQQTPPQVQWDAMPQPIASPLMQQPGKVNVPGVGDVPLPDLSGKPAPETGGIQAPQKIQDYSQWIQDKYQQGKDWLYNTTHLMGEPPRGPATDVIEGITEARLPPPAYVPPGGFLSRLWGGAKAGSGPEGVVRQSTGESYRDVWGREHPGYIDVATRNVIPGTGILADLRARNYAGALGRFAGPAVILGSALIGGRGAEVEPYMRSPVGGIRAPDVGIEAGGAQAPFGRGGLAPREAPTGVPEQQVIRPKTTPAGPQPKRVPIWQRPIEQPPASTQEPAIALPADELSPEEQEFQRSFRERLERQPATPKAEPQPAPAEGSERPTKGASRGKSEGPMPEGFTAVDSSAMKGYKYNPGENKVEVIMRDNSRRTYDVTPEKFRAFEKAGEESWGKALNQHILSGRRLAKRPIEQ